MAQLREEALSTQHLLCLMEEWFDRSQPLLKALARFDHTRVGDGRLGCPFCGRWYNVHDSHLITSGVKRFEHPRDCPVKVAATLRRDMLD
jgi:hypothetical protein